MLFYVIKVAVTLFSIVDYFYTIINSLCYFFFLEIVDALDVDWSALMNETKTEFKPGCARKRFTAAHVLSRIGFSQVFAGSKLSEKIVSYCQKQLDEETGDENTSECL